MWTTTMLLTGGMATLVTLTALPTQWCETYGFLTLAYTAASVAAVGWARLQQLQREVLAAFGWPAE